MISIRDVASKCKVSISTVSKAMNDASDISEATKNRIRKVAEEMGYTANISARTLRTNKTNNIGILFTNTNPIFTHEFFSNVLECFKNEVEKNNYDITFINDKNNKHLFSYKNHCEYRDFDGINISEVMGITTYEQNREALGTIAAKKLIECIEHPNSLIEHTIISEKVKIRDSVNMI